MNTFKRKLLQSNLPQHRQAAKLNKPLLNGNAQDRYRYLCGKNTFCLQILVFCNSHRDTLTLPPEQPGNSETVWTGS